MVPRSPHLIKKHTPASADKVEAVLSWGESLDVEQNIIVDKIDSVLGADNFDVTGEILNNVFKNNHNKVSIQGIYDLLLDYWISKFVDNKEQFFKKLILETNVDFLDKLFDSFVESVWTRLWSLQRISDIWIILEQTLDILRIYSTLLFVCSINQKDLSKIDNLVTKVSEVVLWNITNTLTDLEELFVDDSYIKEIELYNKKIKFKAARFTLNFLHLKNLTNVDNINELRSIIDDTRDKIEGAYDFIEKEKKLISSELVLNEDDLHKISLRENFDFVNAKLHLDLSYYTRYNDLDGITPLELKEEKESLAYILNSYSNKLGYNKVMGPAETIQDYIDLVMSESELIDLVIVEVFYLLRNYSSINHASKEENDKIAYLTQELVHALTTFNLDKWYSYSAGMARGVSDMSAQLQKVVNARLYRQANYDTLTRIPNRQKYKDDMKQRIQWITSEEISEEDLYLLTMDIDHFKKVNDTYWHHVWDVALKSFSDILLNETRTHDIKRRWDDVYRIGWEEFAIIARSSNVEKFCKKINTAIKDCLTPSVNRIIEEENIAIEDDITVSIWVTQFNVSQVLNDLILRKYSDSSAMVEDVADIAMFHKVDIWNKEYPGMLEKHIRDQLSQQADLALYESKDKGRNTYTISEKK